MIIDVAAYRGGARCEDVVSLDRALEVSEDDDGFVWLGLYEPTAEEFEVACRRFDLHELAVEDAINAHQRPKLEVYGDTLSIVLKTARYLDAEEEVEFGEIFLFVGVRFVVAVRHGEASALGHVRAALEARPDRLACGPSAVLHAIVDHVVDDYLPVLAGIDNDIEEVEGQVFSREGTNPVERIYNLKREVLDFHRATVPLVDPVERLAEGKVPNVHTEIRPYFRDVHDHLVRVTERVVTDRDLLNSILEANLTQVGLRQNEDMRKMSAWVSILAVPTMIAGIYGMNFEHMPELHGRWSYPILVGAVALFCVALYRYLRRIRWL